MTYVTDPSERPDAHRAEAHRDGFPDPSARRRVERSDHSPWNWLLVVPLLLTLYPPLYNHDTPRVLDLPFFYWFQLVAILISVAVTLLVYRKTKV